MFKKLKEFFGFGKKTDKVTDSLTNKIVETPRYTRITTQDYTLKERTRDDDSFALSMAVGMATDSALLGGVVGGDFLGGLVGQELADLSSPSFDTSSDTSSGDSFDTSSDTSSGDSFSGFDGGGGDSGGGGASGDW